MANTWKGAYPRRLSSVPLAYDSTMGLRILSNCVFSVTVWRICVRWGLEVAGRLAAFLFGGNGSGDGWHYDTKRDFFPGYFDNFGRCAYRGTLGLSPGDTTPKVVL